MRNMMMLIGGAMLLASSAAAQEARTETLAAAEESVETDAYPAESLRLGEEGVVHYQVELDRKGELETCEVTRSSGFERLDRATCMLLVRQARFKPAVDTRGKPVRSTQNGKIVWQLPQGS